MASASLFFILCLHLHAVKYKRLSKEELDELEKEFIDFLVINGIAAEDWQQMKTNQTEIAEEIIDQFSDVVWEGSLRKLEYLHRITERALYAFKCEADKIHLIRLADPNPRADLRDQEYRDNRLRNPSGLKVSKKTKDYEKDREQELYNLIQMGCVISEGALYRSLDQASY